MDFNSFIFPKPKPSYTKDKLEFKDKLIFIPRKKDFSYREISKYNKTDAMDSTFFEKSLFFKTFPDETIMKNDKTCCTSDQSTKINEIPNFTFEIENKFIENNKEDKEFIPCLFLKTDENNKKCDKIILYFHANYEDLGNCNDFLNSIANHNRINILAVEYKGYGIYDYGSNCSAEDILKDADIVYNFLINVMKIKQENIIIFGRCIGSGPAIYLSYTYFPKLLLLMSAFTSLKEAAKSVFDKYKLGWLCEKIIRERYNN